MPDDAIRLHPTVAEKPAPNDIGWFGGRPRLPETLDWPRTRDGEPMLFACQLDASALPDEAWEGLGPRSGWLAFFMSDGMEAAVLHFAAPGEERLAPRGHPGVGAFTWDRNGWPGDDQSAATWKRCGIRTSPAPRIALADKVDHQIGGPPKFFHDGAGPVFWSGYKTVDENMRAWWPKIEPPFDKGDNLLLLQLASDRRPNWIWGDMGAIYFIIAQEDLAIDRFDRVALWAESR
ncbi:MAG: YwqG family protein [Pseudomonadota bacterium]